MPVLSASPSAPIAHYAVVIIGGGACGLTAALAARDAGADVLVIERDASPRGTTAMSTGLVPAAGTPDQAAAGISDSAALLAADIKGKAKGGDAAIALRLAEQSAAAIDWLRTSHGVPFSLVTGFLYPGHSVMRMMGTPNRTGEELMAALLSACNAAGVDILTDAAATDLVASDARIEAVIVTRPDGAREAVGCGALVLACSGFGGNADMVARHIPEIEGAVFHGHPGNKGDAIAWGLALGAATADMDAYQGHGGLAHGHGIPILWPLIMEGGFQVNRAGQRFSNEALGYSEQAAKIVAQPDRIAFSIFDERLHQLMLGFDDYRDALSAGAVIEAASIADLAARTGLPEATLAATLADVEAMTLGTAACPFGRDFTGKPPLAPPYRAARVTGALFHTQGGLVVDSDARVLRADGSPLPNLFAGGGAARGVSGAGAAGYIAGNGLLTATGLGRLAGIAAAAQTGAQR
ncbi:MAG: FAD-dependent oxidoreductase [Polymorphobacter sp.]